MPSDSGLLAPQGTLRQPVLVGARDGPPAPVVRDRHGGERLARQDAPHLRDKPGLVVSVLRHDSVRVRRGLEDVERIVAKRRLPAKGVLRCNAAAWFGSQDSNPWSDKAVDGEKCHSPFLLLIKLTTVDSYQFFNLTFNKINTQFASTIKIRMQMAIQIKAMCF